MSFSVIIPSARASNLIPCVQALLANEPTLPAEKILVVDDGARTPETEHLPVTWVPGVKPFVFARNVNLGISAAGTDDVILLNDDAQLLTPHGFARLSAAIQWAKPVDIGVCSAAIDGVISNDEQRKGTPWGTREVYRFLAFVCVYIPRDVIDRIGLLDERFVGYGFEDYDFCARVHKAQLSLAIHDGCVVKHGEIPSTFRSQPDIPEMYQLGRELYHEKWGGPR